MSDVFDKEIAELQITQEVLEQLGITEHVKWTSTKVGTQPDDRINNYGKFYRQLWKFIHEPSKE